ncbi:hypothetical protein NBRC116594_35890 [Shimia sp. NS0008-38b]
MDNTRLQPPYRYRALRIGSRLHDHLDPNRFRRLTLLVLVLAGVNLLRKGMMG